MPNALLDRPDLDADQQKDDDELGWLQSNYDAPDATESGSSILQERQKAIAQKELESVKELDKEKQKQDALSSEDNGNEPKWFTGAGAKKKTKGWFTKKKTATIAGLTASVVGFSAMFLGPMMGPLEFIHLAETLRIPHLGAQEDAGDVRLNALLRYAKKRSAGETRLSWLESKYMSRISADMTRAGFLPGYDSITSQYKGLGVDTTSEKSPYKGMSNDEVKARLEQKFGKDAFQIRDGKFYMPEGKDTFRQQYKTLRLVSKEMGYNGLTAAMRARTISKYGVVTWNPLKKLDMKANQKLADLYRAWKKSRDASIKKGWKTTVTTAGLRDGTDEKAKPVDGAGAVDGDAEKSRIKSVFDSVRNSKTASAAGGLAAVAGVVCLAKAVNDQSGEIKYLQIVEPLMREGTEALAAGNQVASGLATNDSFNDKQLDVMSKLLTGKDANGNITSWDQAQSIRENNGGSGGVPLESAVYEALASVKIPYLSWTEGSVVGGLCGTAGVVITTGVSLTLTVISGGFASAAVALIAGPYFTEKLIDNTSALVAGEAVNLDALGASYGARADMGVKLAADLAVMQSGGEVMSTADTLALNEVVMEADEEEFARLPLKDRLFAASERRSLVGKLVDSYPKSGDETLNSVASLFSGTLSKVASGLGSLSPKASAQTLNYNYGTPKFGFTLDELADERFADPYENAAKAATVFNGANGATYTTRALECYGVSITKTAEGWSATSQQNAHKEYFKTGERKAECIDKQDSSWMQTRYFILDTATMDSYSCLQGEGQSCTNSGFGSGSAAAAAPAVVATSAVNIADLSKESASVACAAGTKDLGIQDGYSGGVLVKIRICAIPGMKNTGSSRFPGDDGNVAVNSRLSGAWFELYKKAAAEGITLAASSGYRTYAKQESMYLGDSRRVARPGYSNHQMGLAVDIAGIAGVNVEAQTCSTRVMALDNPTWQWLNKNTAVYGIKQYSAEAWHWDPNPGGLPNRCGGDGTLRT